MKNADKQYTFESEAYTVTIDGKQDNGTEIKVGALVEARGFNASCTLLIKIFSINPKSVTLIKDENDCSSRVLDSCKATENGDGSGKSVTLVKCGKLGDVNVSRAVKMRIPKIIS